LRLALALDRTHQQHVGEVKVSVRKDGVRIMVQAHGDAAVDLWAAERKVELFEKVFDRKVRFATRETSSNGRVNRRSQPSAISERKR
jgi:exopolyphosphatase/guanosine-5'-triphosphate,3'-diphosphate pyrophosphatase